MADGAPGVKLRVGSCWGARGKLLARVIETRQSDHVGDQFRKILPSMPKVGEEIVLGEGELAIATGPQPCYFAGIIPDDGRDKDWLDPRQLYRVVHQTVDLVFRSDGVQAVSKRLIKPPVMENGTLEFRAVRIEKPPVSQG
jgi:hypothetical protein